MSITFFKHHLKLLKRRIMTHTTSNGIERRIVPTLLDNFLNNNFFDRLSTDFSSTSTTLPAVNIKETNDAFEVEMAAPGMKKEDFNIELENQILKISSEKRDRSEQKEGDKVLMREYSYQSFERNFQLSKQVVDADRIRATYEHGILHILIPKREEAKQQPARRIDIQ
jgi:HSP20 family protein